VQRIGSPQAERMLVREPRCDPKMQSRNRKKRRGFRAELREQGQGVRAGFRVELSRAQFDRQSGREFRDDPLADRKLVGQLFAEPGLYARCSRLGRIGRNEN
jgi:hypothetical protein